MFSRLAFIPFLALTVAFQSPADSIQKHYRAAQAFQSTGKEDDARAEFRAALGETYQHLGKVLLAEERYTQAGKAFDRAVANGNTSEEILLAQATAYFYIQEYEKANEPLSKDATRDSRINNTLIIRGQIRTAGRSGITYLCL